MNMGPIRWVVSSVLVRAVVVGLTVLGWSDIVRAEAKPNVVFILTDDMRWDAMGCVGNSIIQTPSLDKLAAGGVVVVP